MVQSMKSNLKDLVVIWKLASDGYFKIIRWKMGTVEHHASHNDLSEIYLSLRGKAIAHFWFIFSALILWLHSSGNLCYSRLFVLILISSFSKGLQICLHVLSSLIRYSYEDRKAALANHVLSLQYIPRLWNWTKYCNNDEHRLVFA